MIPLILEMEVNRHTIMMWWMIRGGEREEMRSGVGVNNLLRYNLR